MIRTAQCPHDFTTSPEREASTRPTVLSWVVLVELVYAVWVWPVVGR